MTILWKILACVAGIGGGVVLGCGAVVCFNRMPGKWLCDYDQEPDEELAHPTRQRVRSTPWKYVFSALFSTLGVYLFAGKETLPGAETWPNGMTLPGEVGRLAYGLAVLAALWLLLLMSIADIKYRIVPDQLVILLAVCGCGFVPFHPGGPLSGVWGGLAGMGLLTAMALLGRLLYRRDTVGGGDVKLFGALGLCTGLGGVLTVFVLTSFLSAGHFAWLLVTKRAKMTDRRPMVPYMAVSAGIYLVLLAEMQYTIWIEL